MNMSNMVKLNDFTVIKPQFIGFEIYKKIQTYISTLKSCKEKIVYVWPKIKYKMASFIEVFFYHTLYLMPR